MRRSTLSRRVTLFTTLGLGVIWGGAVLLMSSVLWSEQDELFDQQLVQTAHVLLPLVSQMEVQGVDIEVGPPTLSLNEALLYRLYSPTDEVLQQSDQTVEVRLPDIADVPSGHVVAAPDYRIYVTPPNSNGDRLLLAAPLDERLEAFREGFLAFLLPMIALLPLTWLLVGVVTRRAMSPLRELRREISSRDSTRLDMIDASDWPEDLVQVAGVMNGFMARLSQTLEAERAFATNAAHELRTPVAIALAQTQQMRENASNPAQMARLDAVERALQRMRRLVARLLQLARADAGIGGSTERHDLATLTRMIVHDIAPADAARVRINLPPQPVAARIDPDGYAIVLSNLIDNALQHSPAGSPVQVDLHPDAVLEVSNEGQAIEIDDVSKLTQRFARQRGDGFGLGLHICQQIVTAAGGDLQIISPTPHHPKGFAVRVKLSGTDPEVS